MATPPFELPRSPEGTAREASLAALRALSPSQYVSRVASHAALSASLLMPGLSIFFFFDGLHAARFPRVIASSLLPPPAPVLMLPELLAAGLRNSVSCSARTFAWVTLASASNAALQEALGLGLRHAAGSDTSLVHAVGFVSGAGCGALLSADWAARMGPLRHGFFLCLTGLYGAMLPPLLLFSRPFVLAQLNKVMQLLPPDDGASSSLA
jgi:hypothetical protein